MNLRTYAACGIFPSKAIIFESFAPLILATIVFMYPCTLEGSRGHLGHISHPSSCQLSGLLNLDRI